MAIVVYDSHSDEDVFDGLAAVGQVRPERCALDLDCYPVAARHSAWALSHDRVASAHTPCGIRACLHAAFADRIAKQVVRRRRRIKSQHYQVNDWALGNSDLAGENGHFMTPGRIQ